MKKSELIKNLPTLELPSLNSFFNINAIDTKTNNKTSKQPIKAQINQNTLEKNDTKKLNINNINERQLLLDIYKKLDNIENKIYNN